MNHNCCCFIVIIFYYKESKKKRNIINDIFDWLYWSFHSILSFSILFTLYMFYKEAQLNVL